MPQATNPATADRTRGDDPRACESRAPGLCANVRRILALGLVAGYVDAVGFLDLGGVHIAAMTGDTIELGISAARDDRARLVGVAATIAAFFAGGLAAGCLRRRAPCPAVALTVMIGLILSAQLVRSIRPDPVAVELPLLALAMATQGQALSRFGGARVQTVVVTSNLLNFADAAVGRRFAPRAAGAARPDAAEVVLPACVWLGHAFGAVGGALAVMRLPLPLIAPALALLVVAADFFLADGAGSRPRCQRDAAPEGASATAASAVSSRKVKLSSR
ncbi:YoaK family protein [Methylocella sp.]|uniref:YoaK family protein n=1 Tax=Methylocella sp. TaxID=1978226 RepID=UPI003784B518